MPDRLDTTRLTLRPFEAEDVEAAFRWFGDPEVMRFTPTGTDPSLDATRRRVEAFRKHQQIHGFSKWIIRERGCHRPIGDSGLLVLPESGKIDLGFRLARPYWGRGLATEAASAWVRAAFLDLRLAQLTAFADPRNVPSLRILEKTGFRRTGCGRVMGMNAVTFSLDASEYRMEEAGKPSC